MLKRLFHKLFGYSVVIYFARGIAKEHEPFVCRCWLSSDCTVRVHWNGNQLILNSNHTVSGVPESWGATWQKHTPVKTAKNK